MHRGNMIDRGRPGTGYDLDAQQETITWGQGFNAPTPVTAAAPGIYNEQLVNVRYPRPTSWNLLRIIDFGDSGGFAAGDTVAVSWRVRIGIGQLNSEFFLSDLFTFPLPATTTLPFFANLSIPAKTVQVTLVSVFTTGAGNLKPRLAAMMAPVVE